MLLKWVNLPWKDLFSYGLWNINNFMCYINIFMAKNSFSFREKKKMSLFFFKKKKEKKRKITKTLIHIFLIIINN